MYYFLSVVSMLIAKYITIFTIIITNLMLAFTGIMFTCKCCV